MLEFSTFTIKPPDDSDCVELMLKATYTNATDATVRLLHTTYIPFTGDGVPVTLRTEKAHVRLEQGDGMELDPVCSYLAASDFPNGITGMRMRLVTNSYARVFVQLGELPLPVTPAALLLRPTTPVRIAGDGDDFQVAVIVAHQEDSPEEYTVTWRCLLTNTTGTPSAWAVLKADLVDSDGAELETASMELALQTQWPEMVEHGFYRLQRGQLSGSRLRFSLSVFPLVATVTAEFEATAEEPDPVSEST